MLNIPILTHYFREQLVLVFSEYLKDFSKKNISELNLGISSTLLLENLEIREDLLLLNSLPLVINEGRINRIKISIPSLFKNISMRMDIEDVEIHVRLLVEQRNFDDIKQNMYKKDENQKSKSIWAESFKQRKLKDWENKMRKYFKGLAPPNWAKKIIDNIMKNIIISIKNVTIYYESFSLLNMPSLCKVTLDELNINSTDENWFPAFNSGAKILYRQILLSRLSITLNLNKNYQPYVLSNEYREKFEKEFLERQDSLKLDKGVSNFSTMSDRPRINYERLKMFLMEGEDFLEKEYIKLQQNDTYLLFPIDATIKIKQHLDLSKDFSSTSQNSIWFETKKPFIFMLNKNHMRYLGSLNEHIRVMNIVKKNIHLRPSESPIENPTAWWIYAIKAINEEQKTIKSLTRNTSNLLKMRRYIDIYKRKQTIIHVPWLPRATAKEKTLFKTIEDQLPLQKLLDYREWAFVEIRIEAKKFSNSNQGVQRLKPLIDIWSNAINNEAAFTKKLSKAHVTIRLTPQEQSDLYEILALDKNKVLESYLKGFNSDPKDIVQEFHLHIHSLYCLITEPKEESTKVVIDSDRFKISSVKDWWLKDKEVSLTNHEPIIRSFPNIETITKTTLPTEKALKSDIFLRTPKNTLLEFPEENNFGILSDSKYSMKNLAKDLPDLDLSKKSDSYIEHLKDVGRDTNSHDVFIEIDEKPKIPDPFEEKYIFFDLKPNSTQWWNQNLILLIEIIAFTAGIRSYKSGRLMTHKPFEMKSIMISTAMNLSKAIKDRDEKNDVMQEPFNFRLKYQTLFKNILHYDYNTVYQINNASANPLLKFLRENNCQNFAAFLETYDKDRKSNGVHVVENIQPYKPFFHRHHALFIDFPTDISIKFHECAKMHSEFREDREKVLHEAYNSLKLHITKNLMPSFLFSYGALVLPLILNIEPARSKTIAHLRNNQIVKEEITTINKLKRFPTTIQRWNVMNLFSKKAETNNTSCGELVNENVLSFSFDLHGAKCQFRIEKIDMHKEKGKGEQPPLNCNVLPKEPDLLSGVSLNLAPVTIYLSTESFKPLVVFFKNFNAKPAHKKAMEAVQKLEEEQMFSVEEYQKIMQCIDYNKREHRKCEDIKKMDIKADFKRISFEVSNFRSHYIHERKLNLQLDNLTLDIREPEHPQGPIDTEIKKLKAYYKKIALDIGNIEIVESFYDNEIYNNIVLLKTKLTARLYHCVFDNHPLHTDKKIHLHIPYLNLHIDDNLVLFCELIQLYKKGSILQKKKKNVLPPPTPIIEMGENQKNKLANRLHTLLKDHKPGAKNCKHCILRYKKSSLLMNIFVGDLTKNLDIISDTTFAELASSSSNDLEKGLGLLVTIKHSLTRKQNMYHNTILHLPFFVLTKDMGFFKDNIAIHCSEASPILVNPPSNGPKLSKEAIISKFKPGFRAKKDCLANLDEKFWLYFRDLEGELSKPKKEEGDQGEVIKEIDEEDEDDENEQEELINILPSLKRFSTLPDRIIFEKGKESFFNSAQSLYVLFVSKRYLRRELLKEFDIGKRNKDFNDYITFRLKDLSISFNSLNSFASIANTLDAFGQINEWLGQFILTSEFKNNLSTSEETSSLLDDDNVAIDRFRKMMQTINISFIIDKINLAIDCDMPNQKFELEVNKVSLENSHNRKNILDHGSVFKRPIWDLFSIENIRIQTSAKGFGLFEKINLKYHELSKELKFSINKIYYNCPSKLQESIISIPQAFMKNPKLNPKALDVCFVFANRMLSAINVIVSPIDLYLSDIDLVELLSSWTILNAYRNQLKNETTRVLSETVFERNIFERIKNNLDEIQKALPKRIKRKNPKKPKVGPFVANPNMLIAVLVEDSSIKFAKDHTMFANLGITGIKFEMELNGNYRAEVENISLKPNDSSYQNIITNMIKDRPMYIRVYKQDGKPNFHFENCRVTYISRTIKELMKWNKELTAELQNVANQVQDLTLRVSQIGSLKSQSTIEDEKPTTAPFKLLFEDSCLALPRDSKSRDVLVIMGRMTEITLGSETRFVEIPTKKATIISVNEKTRTVNMVDVLEKIKAKVNLMNVVISGTQFSYSIANKHIRLGECGQTTMVIANPSTRTTNGTWVYESTLDMDLEDYNLSINAVAMEEAKKIMNDNFKEQSEIYQLRTENRFNIRLKYGGQDAGIGITRNRIPGDLVRPLIELREQRERNRRSRPSATVIGIIRQEGETEDKENKPPHRTAFKHLHTFPLN